MVPGHPQYEPEAFSVDLKDVPLYVSSSNPEGEAKLNRTLALLQAASMVEFQQDTWDADCDDSSRYGPGTGFLGT